MKLTRKITLYIVVFIVLVFVAFALFNTYNMINLARMNEESQAENKIKTVNAIIEEDIMNTKVSVFSISNNKYIAKLFAERNREGLLKELLPVFESIKKDVAQFQFHLPNSDSFLRLHKPEKFGDSLKGFRFTVNKANEKKEVVSGIEKGRAGFGIRVVAPVTYNQKHIGTVEYGKNFGKRFLSNIKHQLNSEAFIYDITDENAYELIASTINQKNEFTSDTISKLKNNENIVYNSKDGLSQYILIPFLNYDDDVEGFIALIGSRKSANAIIKKDTIENVLISILVIVFLIAFIIILLRKKIARPLVVMNHVLDKVSNYDLQVLDSTDEINQYIHQNDEIGEMIQSLDTMVSNLKEILSKINESAQNTAATAEELTATTDNTNETAIEVSSAVTNIAEGAVSQAEDTTKAAGSVEENIKALSNMVLVINKLHTAIEDIESKKTEGKTALSDLTRLSEENKEEAEFINNIIIETNDSAEAIYKSSEMIQEIADQTNLLALNAAIDFAHAL